MNATGCCMHRHCENTHVNSACIIYLQTQSLKLLHQLFSLVRWERLAIPHICARTLLSEAYAQRLNRATNISLHYVGYTVLTAVTRTHCIYWDTTLYSPVKLNQYFRVTCHLCLLSASCSFLV